MFSRHAALAPAVMLLAAAGCAATGSNRLASASSNRSSTMTTLHANQLGSATTLLSALRGRVSGMTVNEMSPNCPSVTFRGTRSILGDNSAVVYVDGIRAADTCILTTLATSDVDRVEVYAMGTAPRPPYQSHPNGLLLVFTRRASDQ